MLNDNPLRWIVEFSPNDGQTWTHLDSIYYVHPQPARDKMQNNRTIFKDYIGFKYRLVELTITRRVLDNE